MRSIASAAKVVTVGAVLLAAFGTAQAQTSAVPVPCRDLVGFASTPPGDTGPLDPLSGAWKIVNDNAGEFFSRNFVDSCRVKVVSTTGKGKPQQSEYLAPTGISTQIRADECSMYKYLSSVDSNMSQGKTLEALTVINSMIAKVGTMQITELGRANIGTAATAVQMCIIEQL